MKTKNYPCSQSALYQVAQNVCQSMANNLADFSNFRTKYTQVYLDALKNEISMAENLLDFRGRSAQSEVDYIKLCEQLEICLTTWNTLKRYIDIVYSKAEEKPRLDEAGAPYYANASKKNWDAAKSLMNAGKSFIANHTATLEANQNMPSNFVTVYNDTNDLFNSLLVTYQQSSEKIIVDTDKKISANNEIYEKVKEICFDAQVIYKNNEPLKEQFIISSLIQLVSGSGTSGFKGYIFDAITNKPLAGVSVTSTGFTKAVTTDENGFYEMLQIAEGKYPIAFTLAGYTNYTITDYAIDSGVVHNLNINLTPMGS